MRVATASLAPAAGSGYVRSTISRSTASSSASRVGAPAAGTGGFVWARPASDSANIATEGLSLGLASGITFGVNRHLQVGATFRFANWYLPPNPEVIAFGEVASLSNRVTMLNLALTVAYHSH